MNSYSTHGDLLADRLTRLDVDLSPKQDDQPVQAPVTDDTTHPPKPPYDGYGFRPPSGMSSPRCIHPPPDRNSPLPDVNGLGWPGQSSFSFPILSPTARTRLPRLPYPNPQAKSTLSRLNASAAEKKSRETRLTAAVRTVLECIGEDPDREGLLRTPERYAQALMWMTKGYEERLAGMSLFAFHPSSHIPLLPFTPPPFFFPFPRVYPPPPLPPSSTEKG